MILIPTSPRLRLFLTVSLLCPLWIEVEVYTAHLFLLLIFLSLPSCHSLACHSRFSVSLIYHRYFWDRISSRSICRLGGQISLCPINSRLFAFEVIFTCLCSQARGRVAAFGVICALAMQFYSRSKLFSRAHDACIRPSQSFFLSRHLLKAFCTWYDFRRRSFFISFY